MGLFPGSQAPPMPSYLAPAFHTVQRVLHTLHKILAVPGNLAWERREGSPNVCSSSKPVHTCSSPSLLLNSSSAHTFKSEMHNSVKSAGVRIYSQAGAEVVALHSNGSTEELRIPELRSSWQGTREQVVASGSIPRRGTRHQNIESGSPSHLILLCVVFPARCSQWLVMVVRHKPVYVDGVRVSLIQPEHQTCRRPRLLQLWLRKAQFLAPPKLHYGHVIHLFTRHSLLTYHVAHDDP